MQRHLPLIFLVFASLNCETTIAYSQSSDAQKFLMFDEPTFVNALSAIKGEKTQRIDAYGVFINGTYAGQIGDNIRIGQQISAHINIVARTDGKVWSNVAAGRPSDGKLFGLAGLQLDVQSPQNIMCSGLTEVSCRDEFEFQHMGKTDVLIFKRNAFSDKQLVSLNLGDFGFGPTPKKTDMKTIDVRTDPDGAEIYLDNIKQWKPTNSVMNIPFAKVGESYLPHSLTLRLDKESKSSGNVLVKYENSSVTYNFKTGAAEVK